MAAFQQLLLSIGQNLGTLFLDPSFTAEANASSIGNNSAGADLFLTISNSGVLNVTSVTREFRTTSQTVNTLLRTYNWLTNGTASLYSVRIIRNSGVDDFFRDTGQSQVLGEWIKMTETSSWMLRNTAAADTQPPATRMNFTLQIARTDDESTILASGVFDFTCQAESVPVLE